MKGGINIIKLCDMFVDFYSIRFEQRFKLSLDKVNL